MPLQPPSVIIREINNGSLRDEQKPIQIDEELRQHATGLFDAS